MKKYFSYKELFEKLDISLENLEDLNYRSFFKKHSPVKNFVFDQEVEIIPEDIFKFLISQFTCREDYVVPFSRNSIVQAPFKIIGEENEEIRVNNLDVYSLIFLLRKDILQKWSLQLLADFEILKPHLEIYEQCVLSHDMIKKSVEKIANKIPLLHKTLYVKTINKKLSEHLYENIGSMFTDDYSYLPYVFNQVNVCNNKNLAYFVKNKIDFSAHPYNIGVNISNLFNIETENITEYSVKILAKMNLLTELKYIKLDQYGKIKRDSRVGIDKTGVGLNIHENIFIKTGKEIYVLTENNVKLDIEKLNKMINNMSEKLEVLKQEDFLNVQGERLAGKIANIEKKVLVQVLSDIPINLKKKNRM